jgi:preprotein translocase subunit SecA
VLAGWSGRPCHVVTVNDYLAERDAEEFEPLYSACGLRAACVIGTMHAPERQRGHAADVTYTTSKELLADFLRDRLALGGMQTPARWMVQQLRHPGTVAGTVMRGLHHAIVDEADSVLIDEAVTPLIIAGSDGSDGPERAYRLAWQLAARLQRDRAAARGRGEGGRFHRPSATAVALAVAAQGTVRAGAACARVFPPGKTIRRRERRGGDRG